MGKKESKKKVDKKEELSTEAKKIKYYDEVLEVNEEDQKRVDRDLLKLLSMGELIGNLDSDSRIDDPLPIGWVIKDICGDMGKILFKYGLSMGVC